MKIGIRNAATVERRWRRLRVMAQPYNDHFPFVPFQVEYWRIHVLIRFGGRYRRLFSYMRRGRLNREIRLRPYAPHPFSNCFDSQAWTG